MPISAMNLGTAQQLLDKGRPDAAAAALGPVDPAAPRDPRAVLVLARIHEAAGDLQQAAAVLDALRKARPVYAPAHLYFGIYEGDAGRAESSLQAFDRVLELQPDNDLAHSSRALALLQLGRDAEAAALFRSRGFNDNRLFRVRLTEWVEQQWLDSDRYFNARPALPDPLPSEAPARPPGYISRMRIERQATKLFLAQDYPAMLKVLDPLATAQRPDLGVLYTCAFASEMVHDYARALDYLSLLPQDAKSWPDSLLAVRGRVLVRMRRFREAAEDLNRVEVIGPEDYGANYYFGVLCLAAGDRRQARRLFHRAHTQYLIDTLEYQWWQIERALTG